MFFVLDGQVSLKIPPGSQPNTKFKLRGKGVRRVDNPNIRGNQIVTLIVNIPQSLTQKQKDLIAEFGKEENSNKEPTPNNDDEKFSIKKAFERLSSFISGNKKQ